MKRSISYILTFILMLLFTFLFVFILTEFQLSKTNIITTLESNNYYQLAYENISGKVNDYIVNEDVKELYNNYITVDVIKNDVNSIVDSIYNKKKYNLDHYEDFYKIINNYTSDKDICHVYARGINEIYKSNIFPIEEVSIINTLYFNIVDISFVIIVALLIILCISLLIFFINKNFKYHCLSLIASGFIMIIPFLIIRITGLFDNFIYTNEYYTNLILSLIINAIFSIFMLAMILLIGFSLKILFNKNDE